MLCADCVFWPWLFEPLVRTLGVLLSGPSAATLPRAAKGGDVECCLAASPCASEADKDKSLKNGGEGASASSAGGGSGVSSGDKSGGDAGTDTAGDATDKTKIDAEAEGCVSLSDVDPTGRRRQVWISGGCLSLGFVTALGSFSGVRVILRSNPPPSTTWLYPLHDLIQAPLKG